MLCFFFAFSFIVRGRSVSECVYALCLIHAMSQVKLIDCQGAGAGAFKATFTIAAGGTGLGEIGESPIFRKLVELDQKDHPQPIQKKNEDEGRKCPPSKQHRTRSEECCSLVLGRSRRYVCLARC